MKSCDFEKLVAFLDKQLNINAKLDVLDHLDHCDICRDAVFHIARDRDANLFIYRPYKVEKILARKSSAVARAQGVEGGGRPVHISQKS